MSLKMFEKELKKDFLQKYIKTVTKLAFKRLKIQDGKPLTDQQRTDVQKFTESFAQIYDTVAEACYDVKVISCENIPPLIFIMKNMDLIALSTVNLDLLNSQPNEIKSVSQLSTQDREEQLKRMRDRRNQKRQQSQISQNELSKGYEHDLNYSLEFLNSHSQDRFQTKSGKSVQFTQSVLQNDVAQSLEMKENEASENIQKEENTNLTSESKPASELEKFLSKLNINYDEDIEEQLSSHISTRQQAASHFSPLTSQNIRQNIKVSRTPQLVQDIRASVHSPINSLNDNVNKLDNDNQVQKIQNNLLNSQQKDQIIANFQVSPQINNKGNSEMVSSKITISQVRSPSPSPTKVKDQEILSMSQLVDELQGKIKQHIQTITSQKAQIFQLMSDVEQKQLTNANLQTKIEGYSNKISEQQMQFNNMQQQFQEVEGQKLEIEKQCEFLQQQLQTQQNINSKLILNQNNAMLNNEISQLKQQIQTEKNQIQKLQNDINEKQDNIQEQARLINEQQDKINELQDRTQLLNEQISKQNNLLKVQEDAQQAQHEEISSLQDQISRIPILQQKIDTQNQQIIKYKLLQNEHFQLSQNNDLLNQQIQKLKQEKKSQQLLIKQQQDELASLEHTLFEHQNMSKASISQQQSQNHQPAGCITCQTYQQQIEQLSQLNMQLSEQKAQWQQRCEENERKLEAEIQKSKTERFNYDQLQTQMQISTNEVQILMQNIQQQKLEIQTLQQQNQKLITQVNNHQEEIKQQRVQLLSMDATNQKALQFEELIEKQNLKLKELSNIDLIRQNQEERIKELLYNEQRQDQSIKYVTSKYNEMRSEFEKNERLLETTQQKYNEILTKYNQSFQDNQQIIHQYQGLLEQFNQLKAEKTEYEKVSKQQEIQLNAQRQEYKTLMNEFTGYKEKTNSQLEQLMNLNRRGRTEI